MTSADSLIETSGICRSYGKRMALAPLDFCLRPGTIQVLAGPNGSGKSTLLKMVAGLIRPSSGHLKVLGLEPFIHRETIMKQSAFSFAPSALYDHLTAWEHLQLITRLSGRGFSLQEGQRVLSLMGLMQRAKDRAGTFSLGMRQRLSLAMTLLPLPKLLVLDEPTDGLDPLVIRDLRQTLTQLKLEHGMGILLSSHLLTGLEDLADEVLFLNEGQTLYSGPPAQMPGIDRQPRIALAGDQQKGFLLLQAAGFEPELLQDHSLRLRPTDLDSIRNLLASEGLSLTSFHQPPPDYEAAMINLLAGSQA